MSSARVVLALVIVCLAAVAFFGALYEAAKRPVPPKKELKPEKIPAKIPEALFVPATWDEFPDPYGFCAHSPRIVEALEKNISYLEKLDQSRRFLLGTLEIRVSDLLTTGNRLRRILLKCSTLKPQEFRLIFKENFEIFSLKPRQPDGDEIAAKGKKPMLVTGYFHPELEASFVRNSEFKVPLYGTPKDLITVSLKQFDPTLPARTIVGRPDGNKLVPYPTRCEIDYGPGLDNPPVLAYLKSEVDALTLHIQGSALLTFGTGEKRYIHYASSNGRPYRSVAKWLIRRGYLRPGQANWPGIKKWAENHSDLFQRALCENPRYIFFKWEDDGPYGSMGVTLTPLVSVALDAKIYPLGVIGVLDTILVTAKGKTPYASVVVNQDMGNAIRGPYRLDLYCGNGKAGESIAGRLKTPSRLFVLVARD